MLVFVSCHFLSFLRITSTDLDKPAFGKDFETDPTDLGRWLDKQSMLAEPIALYSQLARDKAKYISVTSDADPSMCFYLELESNSRDELIDVPMKPTGSAADSVCMIDDEDPGIDAVKNDTVPLNSCLARDNPAGYITVMTHRQNATKMEYLDTDVPSVDNGRVNATDDRSGMVPTRYVNDQEIEKNQDALNGTKPDKTDIEKHVIYGLIDHGAILDAREVAENSTEKPAFGKICGYDPTGLGRWLDKQCMPAGPIALNSQLAREKAKYLSVTSDTEPNSRDEWIDVPMEFTGSAADSVYIIDEDLWIDALKKDTVPLNSCLARNNPAGYIAIMTHSKHDMKMDYLDVPSVDNGRVYATGDRSGMVPTKYVKDQDIEKNQDALNGTKTDEADGKNDKDGLNDQGDIPDVAEAIENAVDKHDVMDDTTLDADNVVKGKSKQMYVHTDEDNIKVQLGDSIVHITVKTESNVVIGNDDQAQVEYESKIGYSVKININGQMIEIGMAKTHEFQVNVPGEQAEAHEKSKDAPPDQKIENGQCFVSTLLFTNRQHISIK